MTYIISASWERGFQLRYPRAQCLKIHVKLNQERFREWISSFEGIHGRQEEA